MNWNDQLCDAMDLYAEGREIEAKHAFEEIEQGLAAHCNENPEDEIHFELLGQVLELQEEYQQALLRYEKILQFDPDNQRILWKIVELFKEPLESPVQAKSVLENRLLPLDPKNPDYLECLKSCERAIAQSENKSQDQEPKSEDYSPEEF